MSDTDTHESAIYADVHGAPFSETPRRLGFAGTRSNPKLAFAVKSTTEAGGLMLERTIGVDFLTSSGLGTAAYKASGGGCWASNERVHTW